MYQEDVTVKQGIKRKITRKKAKSGKSFAKTFRYLHWIVGLFSLLLTLLL